AEFLRRRQRIVVRNHARYGARLAEEIIERSRIETLEAVSRLALERPHRLDVFLDRGANVFRVATARRYLDVERNRSDDGKNRGKCYRDSPRLPTHRRCLQIV